MKNGLNERQKSFCKEIACGKTGAEAAEKAGYAKRSAAQIASRLLRDADIKDEIAALVRDAANTLGITPIKVLSDIKEIRDRCMQAEPVRAWDRDKREWTETGEWVFNAKGALKANELFMKYLKMFDAEITANVEIRLTPEQEALIRSRRERDG